MSDRVPNLTAIGHPHARLIELISPLVLPLGYLIIDLEIQSHREKVLRIFIDHLDVSTGRENAGPNTMVPDKIGPPKIGIEDCVRVSKALDEPIDQIPEVESLLSGAYELEISSPGINRALRMAGDFEKYAGSRVRLHTYRPLTAEELSNADYQAANPKQKNFLGILSGFRESKVVLSLSLGEKKSKKESRSLKMRDLKKTLKENLKENLKEPLKENLKTSASLPTNSEEEKIILIPLPLISKANLEPEFDFEGSNERE